MTLTLDGLVRALRGQAHGLADRIEAGYRPAGRPRVRKAAARQTGRQAKRMNRHDVAGR
ncbi:MAG: hypothetical protein Q8Q62_11395 [Mesorhizobium sp.]|nr:hypothetical protein [Mesorhizobium sp.]